MAFFAVPLGFVVWLSLLTTTGINTYADGVSLVNFNRIFEPPYPKIIFISLGYAVATTLTCLVLSFPLALAIATAPRRWRNLLLLAVILPFWVSTLVRVFALQQILGRRGVINSALEWLWETAALILPLQPFEPLALLHNGIGVLLGLIYAFLPFAILPLYAAIVRIDHRLLEASSDLGAGTMRTIVWVILPLAWPGISAAAVLICVPALGAFFVSEMLGGPSDLLLGNLIELQFKEANNWPLGAALSLAMLALTFLAFAAVSSRSRRLGLIDG